MNRNEYRRAFIMLRAAMPGYGGHVRLEKRTLTGSMYFIITAPQGVSELSAALVGQRDGACYAAPIGPLVRDRRGQLVLAWTFDPRNIAGRPLEAYAWVAIVATGGPCALALTGNVEGARAVDSLALERAACALFAPPRMPAADLPERETAPSDPEAPEGASMAAEAETQCDVRVYTPTRARLRREAKPDGDPSAPPPADAQPQPAAPLSDAVQPQPPTPQPVEEHSPTPPPADARPQPVAPCADDAQPDPQPPTPQPVEEQPQTPPPADAQPQPATPPDANAQSPTATAAKQLGLDITAPWPDFAEPLRRSFATQPAAEDAPADGYVYVRAPMPDASGYRESFAGLKAENGRITAMRYALPGRRAPEPPPGLEACRWFPTHGEAGFWVADET